MIAFLEGVLDEKQPTRLLINVSGVGYEVFIPLSTYDRLPEVKQSCRLITHHHVREDGETLYGFVTEGEKQMFQMLLGISGIGPRIAMSALSGLTTRDLKVAVVEGDVKRLSSVSGIGKKMAERMVVELRDKLTKGEALEAIAGSDDMDPSDVRMRDSVLALISLGYKQNDAHKMVKGAVSKLKGEASVEEVVRCALVD